MDSETINSLVKKKYGEESAVKGLDYLQKIVQLPFHIPTWKEVDISSSISKIISKGLEGSKLVEEFENNKSLIIKAIELNPRQVKRFINNIILAESVFGKPVDELIAVQALNFRKEWWRFLDLITANDERRKAFFNEYKKIREEGKLITTKAELDKLIEHNPLLKQVADIYRELVRQGNSLRDFLDAGAEEILERIQKMEEHRRALFAVGPLEKAPEGFARNDVNVVKGYFCKFACKSNRDNFYKEDILLNEELRDNARALFTEQTEQEIRNALDDNDSYYSRLVRFVSAELIAQGLFREEEHEGRDPAYWKTSKLKALCPKKY
jgi:KAP-like P-loop domain-containing protein